jgi:hypothetical protein
VASRGRTSLLVEWTDQLKKTVERAKALKPQVPGEYLLRKHNGKRYTARGFSAIWQRLMGRALALGKNGEPPAMAQRFTFHDLRAKCARDKKTLEEATALLGHVSSTTHEDDVPARDAAYETFTLENIGQPSKYRAIGN